MPWNFEYRGFVVQGQNGCDVCYVSYFTEKFEWETLYKSPRAAQLCITRHIKEQQLITQEKPQ